MLREHRILVVVAALMLWQAAAATSLVGSIQGDADVKDDAPKPTQAAPLSGRLEPGHPISETLAPHENHAYESDVSEGEYLRLIVEPKDVDLILTVYAQDGHKVLKKTSSYGEQGPVETCLVADQSERYNITVAATGNSAPTGRYQIRIELRRATARDRSRANAEESLAQAQELRAKATLESRRHAISKYSEALLLLREARDPAAEAQVLDELAGVHTDLGNDQDAANVLKHSLRLFQAVGDKRGEGMAMSDLGSVESDLGDNKEGLADLINALGIRKGVGDRRGEAETLEYIGVVYQDTGETDKALAEYNAALSLRRIVGDRFGEAQSLDDIGLIYYYLDDERTALDYYDRALPVQQELHDLWGESLTFNNFGTAYDSLGEEKKAVEYFAKTLSLKRELGNRRGEATSLSNMCSAEFTLGEWQNALDHCNEAIKISRKTGFRLEEAVVLTRIGQLYATLGEKQIALNQFDNALVLARAISNPLWEATILSNMGAVLHDLRRYPEALAKYQRALPIRKAVADRAGEAATLNNIGRAYDAQGKRSLALEYFNQALQVARSASSPQLEAGCLSNMARLSAAQGKRQEALDSFSQALEIYRRIGDQRGEASALYGIARVERELDDFPAALTQIELAIKIVETLRGKIANQQLRAAYFSSIGEYYEFYIELLMQLDAKDRQRDYAARALGVSEQFKARNLLDTIREARADIRAGVSPSLLERERSLQQLLDAKTERQIQLLASHNEKVGAATKKEIEQLLVEYQDVEAQIRVTSPKYAGLTQIQPFDLVTIQKEVLDASTVLLEYSLGEEHSYLWVVTDHSLASFQLPGRADVELLARSVYGLVTARNKHIKSEHDQQRSVRLKRAQAQFPAAAGALSKMVLSPVAELIRGKRLAIVGDGALQYVPFGMLPSPSGQDKVGRRNPLVVDHEIINLPSASVLGLLRQGLANRKPAAKVVAVLADPVFDQEDARLKIEGRNQNPDRDAAGKVKQATSSLAASLKVSRLTRSVAEVGLVGEEERLGRLVFTRQEAKSILALVPVGKRLEALDFDASRTTATSPDLGQYRMIHFATHGSLDSQHPELSGLVLSLVDKQGRSVNGFLDLEDVYNLNLPSELVTLSACETGLGESIKGEGLVGLTRGFMYAGALRVVASLWKVDDLATAELMAHFYAAMLEEGIQPAAALRQAEVEMWNKKRWADPYYWAAFTIQGEWR